MSFIDVMDIIGKFFVGVLIGFLAMYFIGIIIQTIISIKTMKNTVDEHIRSNDIVIDVADKKDKDFYTHCVYILNTYKVSAFCQLFSDDIDKSIEVVNTTSNNEMYIKHIASIIAYFNIYSYEHLIDSRDTEKVLSFINSKLVQINDTAKQKIHKIGEAFTLHADESTVLFTSHYSMLTKDTKNSILKKFAGKKYTLPKLNL